MRQHLYALEDLGVVNVAICMRTISLQFHGFFSPSTRPVYLVKLGRVDEGKYVRMRIRPD